MLLLVLLLVIHGVLLVLLVRAVSKRGAEPRPPEQDAIRAVGGLRDLTIRAMVEAADKAEQELR